MVSINTEDSAVSPVVIPVRIEITEVIVAIILMAAKIIATRKIITGPEPLQTGVAQTFVATVVVIFPILLLLVLRKGKSAGLVTR